RWSAHGYLPACCESASPLAGFASSIGQLGEAVAQETADSGEGWHRGFPLAGKGGHGAESPGASTPESQDTAALTPRVRVGRDAVLPRMHHPAAFSLSSSRLLHFFPDWWQLEGVASGGVPPLRSRPRRRLMVPFFLAAYTLVGLLIWAKTDFFVG